MGIEDIMSTYGMSIADISRRFGIPYKTVQNWKDGRRRCPEYVLGMIDEILDIIG